MEWTFLKVIYGKDGIQGEMGGHENGVLGLNTCYLLLVNGTPREHACMP